MTTSSDHKERRGEPVLLYCDGSRMFDPPLLGTIEWGSRETGFSICTEPGGARFQARMQDFTTDPGGERPLWERRRAEDGENVRAEIKKTIAQTERGVIEAAMTIMGYRGPSAVGHLDLHATCQALDSAEKKLKAVALLGVRTAKETP